MFFKNTLEDFKSIIKGRPFYRDCSNKLKHYLNNSTHPELIFIQIGANDGVDQDKSKIVKSQNKVKSVLVEPQIEIFNRLVENHKNNKNISCINVAVGPKSETKEFYHLTISNARWASGLSSFDLNTIQKHFDNGYISKMAESEGIRFSDFNSIIKSEIIEVDTISSILKKLNLKYPNIIFIDAEGFDYEILKSIDFNESNLDIILMEYIHLDKDKFKESINLLNKHSFNVYIDGRDLFAIRKQY